MTERGAPASDRSGIVETEYFSFIDGLRGIAALMVLAVHVADRAGPLSDRLAQRLVEGGARGVQLFFILSAFTLFASSRQRAPHERRPVRDFYLRRAFRILPLWWFSLIVYSLLPIAVRPETGVSAHVDLLLHATFLFGFFPSTIATLIPVGWSLFVEETFYLLLPLVRVSIGSLLRALFLTAALLAVSIGWYLLVKLGWPGHEYFAFLFPLCQWFCFGLGFVFYFARERITRARISRGNALLFDAFAVVALLGALLLPNLLGPRHYAAAFAFLALCLAVSNEQSFLRRVVDTPFLRRTGKYCYSIYLFHLLVLSALGPAIARMKTAFGSEAHGLLFIAVFAMSAIVCFAVGALLFHAFERPMVKVGRRVVARLESSDAVVAAS